MWLPECAVDDDTLRDVAAAGMKFTILAPEQGTFRGEAAERRGAGPFIWRAESLSLAVFRFDRDLSRAVSFGDGLKDGGELANSIAEAAAQIEPGEVVMIATDGETFGHHKRSGDAELARAIDALELRDDVRLTNCAEYLALHPAGAGSFEIDAPSSWSCPHGVERWRANCGCRMDPATHQEWRGPLREAMDFVNNHATAVYDRFAPPLVDDAAAALHESIRLAIDANPALAEEFFVHHRVTSEANRESLMRLFEMERAAQAALTSCAWFFDDFGGPEGRVVLRWAARAVELAAEFALSIEPELLERLRADPLQPPRDRRRRHAILEPQDARSTREGMIAMADTHHDDIESILREGRKFPPTRRVQPRGPRQEHGRVRGALPARRAGPRSILGRMCEGAGWFKPFDKVLEWKFPFAKWFVNGKLNAVVQLPRSPSDHRAAQQGGAHLGGRAGRRSRADLPDAGERGRARGQRAQEPRREGGRPRRDLHAAGARGDDRDAGVRAYRRDPFGDLRRLLGRGAGRSDQ